MREYKSAIFKFHIINIYIILSLLMIAVNIYFSNYFSALLLFLINVYLVFKVNCYYYPLYLLAKDILKFNKKLDKILSDNEEVSFSTLLNLKKELAEIKAKHTKIT